MKGRRRNGNWARSERKIKSWIFSFSAKKKNYTHTKRHECANVSGNERGVRDADKKKKISMDRNRLEDRDPTRKR